MEFERARGVVRLSSHNRQHTEPSIHLRVTDVSSRRREAWSIGRLLGISLLIASVVRVPLPQADYHNVRHHDAPGEICPLHDHLLRWHPSAAIDADISLLHWHWFVPLGESEDPQRDGDDSRQGPFLHAHSSDMPEPDWFDHPLIGSNDRGRFADDLASRLAAAGCAYFASHFAPSCSEPDFTALCFQSAGDGLRAGSIALSQRWNC
jgi:hypothetical protein